MIVNESNKKKLNVKYQDYDLDICYEIVLSEEDMALKQKQINEDNNKLLGIEEVSFENGNIHYYISKKDNFKKTILFTHGLTADASMFEKQVEYFQDKYNIILWDIPLHGRSKDYRFFIEALNRLNDCWVIPK